MNYFYKYLTIFFSISTIYILHTIYLYLFNIYRDLSYINGLIFSILFGLFISLGVLLIYFIFFSLIYKIRLKNISLYFLVLFVLGVFTVLWEISYQTSGFIDFIFNHDIIFTFLSYIIGIGGYGYYLKYIKNTK